MFQMLTGTSRVDCVSGETGTTIVIAMMPSRPRGRDSLFPRAFVNMTAGRRHRHRMTYGIRCCLFVDNDETADAHLNGKHFSGSSARICTHAAIITSPLPPCDTAATSWCLCGAHARAKKLTDRTRLCRRV